MKNSTSDLLKQMYDTALCNDPRQDVLVPVYHHLYAMGYELEKPAALDDTPPPDVKGPGFVELPPEYPGGHNELQCDPIGQG